MAPDDWVTQTCAYLRLLLIRPGPYRQQWERQARIVEPGKINYDAVARVLAAYRSLHEPSGVTARHLTETVRRALANASVLSAKTLNSFIDAFTMNDRDARTLWSLRRGSQTTRVISGRVSTPAVLRNDKLPSAHETVSLHELHTLGPDGLPAEHETIQVIRSTTQGLSSYPYRFDTDELAVTVVRGGTVGTAPYQLSETLFGVDIILADPLPYGHTALMHYRTTFFYREPPNPEFRRAVFGAVEDLTVQVKFDPGRVPARVWWGLWDELDHDRIIDRRLVELDSELSVHCHYDAVERVIVGFYWSW